MSSNTSVAMIGSYETQSPPILSLLRYQGRIIGEKTDTTDDETNMFKEDRYRYKISISILQEDKTDSFDEVSIKNILVSRIQKLLDRLIERNTLFEGIDRTSILMFLSELIQEMPVGEVKKLNDEVLEKRLKKVLIVEAISNLFRSLSTEDKEGLKKSLKELSLFE